MGIKIEYNRGDTVGNCLYIGNETIRVYAKSVQRFADFQCSCGVIFGSSLNNIRRSHTSSCGCKRRSVISLLKRTHGHCSNSVNSPEYISWQSMKQRCENPNTKGYQFYGGIGVKVCKRWSGSFESFLADMGERPSARHSLDRYPNKTGNYSPENCRWATKEQQSNNMRSNVVVEYLGQKLTISEWAKMVNVKYHTLYKRLYGYGWPKDRALSTNV